MMLFGSARKLSGEEYFERMVSGEELEHLKKMAAKTTQMTKAKKEEAGRVKMLNSIRQRVVDDEEMDEYEAEKLAIIYNNLEPNDISHPISVKMVKHFLEETVKVQNLEAYKNICRYFDFKNPMPEKQGKKMKRLVENMLKQYRTVEYCYQYSKSFHDFVNEYASKVDAEGLDNIEKIKWLRLWLFIIKDQGFFWNDIQPNGTIIIPEQQKFDREVYLFPGCMLYLKDYIDKFLSDKALNVEMLKRFIGLYPEDIQKQVYTWAEMDGDTCKNILRAGEVRMGIKRQLFPIIWMSPMSLFCLNNNIKDNNPEYLKAAIRAYKNGGIGSLNIIKQRGTDPFDAFKVKNFKSYEMYTSPEENGQQQVLVVNSERELEMFVEIYKWLFEHPDFRFGPENKTVSEYGIDNLLDDEPETCNELNLKEGGDASDSKVDTLPEENPEFIKWFFQMNLVTEEEDINWSLFNEIIKGNEELMLKYLEGELEGEELYNKIGFSSNLQAMFACNKRIKLIKKKEKDKKDGQDDFIMKMSEALKRIKMFGEPMASKSDIIYLKIFKHMVSEKTENLPKSMVNLYSSLY